MNDLKWLNPSDVSWDDLFAQSKSEAFRLELYSEYRFDAEKPYLDDFKKKKGKVDFSKKVGYPEWCGMLKKYQEKGGKYWRVRRLSTPLTDYEKFEVAAYKYQSQFGLSVWAFKHSVDCMKIKQLDKVPYAMDYWMFDKKDIYLVQYDMVGHFLGMWQYSGDPKPYVSLANSLKRISKKIA